MLRRSCALFLFLMMVASACASGSDTADVATASGDESTTENDSSGADGDSDSDDSDGDDSDSSSEAPASSGGSDDGPMAASSPIGAFFSDDGGFEAAIAEYTVRVEEAIVLCMAGQGFEFVRTAGDPNEIQSLQNELTAREWTSEYGYGISTSFDTIAQNQAADPNAEILFSLSAGEREIWIETLTGGGLGAAGGDLTSTPLEEQGCIGEALISTGGQEAIEGIETFGSAYEEGEEAIFDQREMVEAVDAWSRCMSEGGYPGFSSPDDPEDSISKQFETVIGPMQTALDDLSPEEGQALVSGESIDIADLPDLDVTALRELQADEIALALADLDCYEVEVQATYEPLRDEFEKGLLEEYATEFDALKNIGQ